MCVNRTSAFSEKKIIIDVYGGYVTTNSTDTHYDKSNTVDTTNPHKQSIFYRFLSRILSLLLVSVCHLNKEDLKLTRAFYSTLV